MNLLIPISLGFLLDFIFGDPYWLPHPIRFIGLLIKKTENVLLKKTDLSEKQKYFRGVLLTLIVSFVSFVVPFVFLFLVGKFSVLLQMFFQMLFCYQIFATKCLKTESMKVFLALKNGDILEARKFLSYIVGRDTAELSEEKIIKATVETVAENSCDGVIAPLVFMLIGGAPLAFLYKAVNTLDSMVGYKNDKYLFFGRFSAKTDDVLNFIPAILSAYFMIISSYILKLDFKNAVKIYKRDKKNHSSPNSGKTESVCAGALNVQLAGDSYYFGNLVKKLTIGDNNRPVNCFDIVSANKLLYGTAITGFFILTFTKIILGGLF